MSYEPPEFPRDVPDSVRRELDTCSVAQLTQVSNYAEALAEHRARQNRLEEQEEDGEPVPEMSRPDGVPNKATLTTKSINDNRYYYWQWREGDKVKSKYKGPASSDE